MADPVLVLDVMGGDKLPEALVEGAVVAAQEGLSILLVGR